MKRPKHKAPVLFGQRMADLCPVCGRRRGANADHCEREPADEDDQTGALECYRRGFERVSAQLAAGAVGQVVGGKCVNGMVHYIIEFPDNGQAPGVGARVRVTREVSRG